MKYPTSSLLLGYFFFSLCGMPVSQGQDEEKAQLEDKSAAPSPREVLVSQAKLMAEEYEHLPYKFGGASPKSGGFDCSGAMYYLLRQCGYKPPRTSAQQYVWLRDHAKIHKVGKKVESFDHDTFKHLKVGDLLFWSGTYRHTDGRKVNISHVGIYLGKEEDGRRIMACSSGSRSYRGKKGNGYGIYDFKLPSKKSKSTFVGYGSVPEME